MPLRSVLLLPLVSVVVGCSSSGDDTGVPTGTTDTTPADDTATTTEPEPVWADRHIETSSTLNGVYVSGAGVYVAGTGGVALESQDDGTWADMGLDVDGTDIGDLAGWGSGSEMVLEVGAGSGLVGRYEGGGWVVTDLGTADTEGVGGSDPDGVFAVTWGGVYYWNGSEWAFEVAPGNPKLNDVFALGTDAIAVGEGGVAAIRAGGVWQEMNTGVSVDLAGVHGSSTSDVWAVGSDGTAIHWDGSVWSVVDTGVDESLWAVWAASPTAVFAVGNAGVAVKWDGSSFVPLPTGSFNNFYSLHGSAENNVFAGGNRGALIRYGG